MPGVRLAVMDRINRVSTKILRIALCSESLWHRLAQNPFRFRRISPNKALLDPHELQYCPDQDGLDPPLLHETGSFSRPGSEIKLQQAGKAVGGSGESLL